MLNLDVPLDYQSDFAVDLAQLYVCYETYTPVQAVYKVIENTDLDFADIANRVIVNHPMYFDKTVMELAIKEKELSDLHKSLTLKFETEKQRSVTNFSCAVEEIVEPVKEPKLTPEEIAEEELEMDETYEKIWSTLQAMHDNWNDSCSLLVA